MDKGFHKGVDFLIVCDASAPFKAEKYEWGIPGLMRLLGIATSQVLSLRRREFVDYLIDNPQSGVFLRNGNTCAHILSESDHQAEIPTLCADSLSEKEVQQAANLGTTLHNLSIDDFELLVRHGYEVANYTLYAYDANRFALIQ